MAYPFNYPGYSYSTAPYVPQNFNPAPVQAPTAPQAAQTGITSPSGYLCCPVTSKAEAEVFQIPFDGSTTYFVDTANGKIYSKTFNFSNGTAPLVTYIREVDAPVPQYASIESVESLRSDFDSLKEEIETMKKKAVKKNDKQDDE